MESNPDNEKSNITVAIRVRPLLEREKKGMQVSNVRVEDNLIIVLDPSAVDLRLKDRKKHDVMQRSREQKYAFDNIFTTEPIENIFEKTAQELIEPVLKGYNGCVFAYGATGTGKTFTMLGNSEFKGLCNITLESIFQKANSEEMTDYVYDIRVCYVEIYNEYIKDLLNSEKNAEYLDLRDDPLKGVTIAGAVEMKVQNVEQIMKLLYQGNKRRTTEATNANEASSRSHAIFQVQVIGKPRTKNIKMHKTIGKLSLIDLAGSERGTVTENRGMRLREGAKINQSLLALANCINALGDTNRKGSFVPYRDSKLTRMLKDSLGGNCKTVMIVTISPSASQFEETINTLKYANRAKNIKTKPIENKKLVELHIAEYKNVIAELRSEVDTLKSKLRTNKSKQKKEESSQFCQCGRKEDEENVKEIQKDLFDNFQERIQLRRGLCELEAQNQLNIMEIQRGQKEMMRYTLTQSGNLMKKEDETSALDNLPPSISKQMDQINTLKASMDLNYNKKEIMKTQLVLLAKEANKIMDEIPNRVKHQDKRNFLELVVKNHFLELENNEIQFNLKLQEKMNKILKKEIIRLKDIMRKNNIHLKEDSDESEGEKPEIDQEEDDDRNYLSEEPPTLPASTKQTNRQARQFQSSPNIKNDKRSRPITDISKRNFKKKESGALYRKGSQETMRERYPRKPKEVNLKSVNPNEFIEIKGNNIDKERSLGNIALDSSDPNDNTMNKLRKDIASAQGVINSIQLPKRIQDRMSKNKGELFEGMAIQGNPLSAENIKGNDIFNTVQPPKRRSQAKKYIIDKNKKR